MTKETTIKIKGIALLLMFWHHFFGLGNFLVLEENNWSGVFNTRLAEIFGQSGKICIALFLFCSGYGLYKSYIAKETNNSGLLSKILKLLIPYWVINVFIAIPCLIYLNKFNLSYLPCNIFALLHNDEVLYVSFSWYVKLQLGILLLLPIIKIIDKKIKNNICIETIIFIVLPIFLSYHFRDFINEAYYSNILSFIFSSALMIASYIPAFFEGMLFAKYNCFESINKVNKSRKRILLSFISVCLFSVILLFRYKFNIWDGKITDLIYAPIAMILIFVFLNNSKSKILSNTLRFIGNYSYEFWLLSGMFFLNTSELQWIAFLPKYSFLIIIWSLLILTPFAIICRQISNYLLNIIIHENK